MSRLNSILSSISRSMGGGDVDAQVYIDNFLDPAHDPERRKVGKSIVLGSLGLTTLLTLPSCVTLTATKPNTPYQGASHNQHLDERLKELSSENNLLYTELMKLPEMQDGFSKSEANAASVLLNFYDQNRFEFNSAFEKMYDVGIAEVRKYNTPLQSLFWLIEDGKLDEAKATITEYAKANTEEKQKKALYSLMDRAWDFKPQPLSKRQMTLIINGTKDPNAKKEYTSLMQENDDAGFKRNVSIDYKSGRVDFTSEAEDLIENVAEARNPRWSDFQTVVDRLNSPELIDYYTRNQFSYDFYISSMGSAKWAFEKKGGNCTEIEAFQSYCLSTAGYNAYSLRVVASTGGGHRVTQFYKPGIKGFFIMDNGLAMPRGILGPFTNISHSPYTPF